MERCSFLQGPGKKGPEDKVPRTASQGGGREEELGQMEDFGHSCQVLRVERRE